MYWSPESPLKVHCRSRTLGPLGDLQGTSPELHVSAGLEVSKALKGYARSYKIEIIDLKNPLAQLEVSKSSIEDLCKDLLNEMKGFKYQITITVLLSKYRGKEDI